MLGWAGEYQSGPQPRSSGGAEAEHSNTRSPATGFCCTVRGPGNQQPKGNLPVFPFSATCGLYCRHFCKQKSLPFDLSLLFWLRTEFPIDSQQRCPGSQRRTTCLRFVPLLKTTHTHQVGREIELYSKT